MQTSFLIIRKSWPNSRQQLIEDIFNVDSYSHEHGKLINVENILPAVQYDVHVYGAKGKEAKIKTKWTELWTDTFCFVP